MRNEISGSPVRELTVEIIITILLLGLVIGMHLVSMFLFAVTAFLMIHRSFFEDEKKDSL